MEIEQKKLARVIRKCFESIRDCTEIAYPTLEQRKGATLALYELIGRLSMLCEKENKNFDKKAWLKMVHLPDRKRRRK